MYTVGHPDDDLLFVAPDLTDDMRAGNCITTLYFTSGDDGLGNKYAQSREAGNLAASAQVLGVANVWSAVNATFGGQPVLVETLTAAPRSTHFFQLSSVSLTLSSPEGLVPAPRRRG